MADTITILEMPDAGTANDTDWVEIARTNSDGSTTTYRVQIAYILSLLGNATKPAGWVIGSGAPTDTEAAGTIYLDKTTGDVYESTGTAWNYTMSLIGPAGDDAGRSNATADDPATRAPTKYDDSVFGYKAGDQWRFGSTVYQCADATEGAAVWNIADSAGAVADIFGSNVQFAGGTQQMVGSYKGAAVDIEVTISGTPTTKTLNILADGTFDIDGLLSALTSADNGTFALVTKVYDQTGQGNDLAVVGSKNMHIGPVMINGIPAISWGYLNGDAGGFQIPANVTVPRNGFFFGQLGSMTSANSGDGAAPCALLLGASSTSEVKVLHGYYEFDGQQHILMDNASEVTAGCPIHTDPAPYAIVSGTGGVTIMSGNESGSEATALGTGTVSGGTIGYNRTGNSYYITSHHVAQATGFILATGTPTQTQLDKFRAVANRIGKYTPQARDCVIMVGDSRTQGYQMYDSACWPTLLRQRKEMAIYNFAVSGATTVQFLKYFPGINLLRNYRNKVAVVWGGINDVANNLGDPTVVTIPNLRQIVVNLKALGFIVAVIHEAQGPTAPRTQVKNALLSGAIPADIIIDPFADGEPMFNRESPDLFYTDYTHPTNGGHQVLARHVWAQIGGYLTRQPDTSS